ncbi:hypothetical protein GUJ93_ZPchr0012g18775 [Zizania palustris]|uniref:Uncharacterized protein n=1 Tax=Zizania palustris TaxID=103762 RepID=A0A8J5WS58_ZIZPA|nr:hypothetical protein GUJ93_ZPchr0012g18775 [Zizania palustris]
MTSSRKSSMQSQYGRLGEEWSQHPVCWICSTFYASGGLLCVEFEFFCLAVLPSNFQISFPALTLQFNKAKMKRKRKLLVAATPARTSPTRKVAEVARTPAPVAPTRSSLMRKAAEVSPTPAAVAPARALRKRKAAAAASTPVTGSRRTSPRTKH